MGKTFVMGTYKALEKYRFKNGMLQFIKLDARVSLIIYIE